MSGKISTNGKMLEIVYPDGEPIMITVNPKDFDKLFEGAIKEKVKMSQLNKERQIRNDKQFSLRQHAGSRI
jgi:ribosomal protein L25 (general stress protein Ctc)